MGTAAAQDDPNYYTRPGRSTVSDGNATGSAPTRQAPSPYAFSGDEVLIRVGESIQGAVDAHPAGTHFRIAAGTHRLQTVAPKDGNTFTGEPGAVLSGATRLDPTAFTRQGEVWVLDGQTWEGFVHGETEPGQERHAAPNDLFLNDTLADHVPTRGAVDAPGEWYFDYGTDQVVLFDNPAEFTNIELSVVESAFRSGASDVTIQHLTITRYAAPAQHGAVHAAEGLNWEAGHITVTDAHGSGVRIGPGFHLHHSRILRSGQLGVGGTDEHDGLQAPALIEYNEIAYNRTLGYAWGWEGGATKFALTRDIVVRGNWVHHNHGPGLWLDVDNLGSSLTGNLVEHNDQAGIFVEISVGALVAENLIRHNGATAVGDLGAGVHVSTSSDVEVRDNAIYGNRSAVMVQQEDRGEGIHGLRQVTNLNVHHNHIVPGLVPSGIRVHHGDATHYWHDAGNRFEANTYHMDPGRNAFWAGHDMTLTTWQDFGHDGGAALAPADTTPSDPTSVATFASEPLGAAQA